MASPGEPIRLVVEAAMSLQAFDELAAELRPIGFEATHTPGWEERGRFGIWEILLRVLDPVDDAAAAALVGAVVGWVKARRRQGATAGMVKVYGPDGKLLKEVRVDPERE
jgi:hypothetical protein